MHIDSNFLESLYQPLRAVVKDASKAIMEIYHKDSYELIEKSDGSPVTEADNNANKIILDSLKKISPNISVVSEETYDKSSEIPKEPYWLIDPLDGTKEFINKSNDFTVNIALIENKVSIFGTICAPTSRQIWQGSKFDDFNNANDIPETLRIVMSKSHQTEMDKEFLNHLKINHISFEIIERGSSLKLCALSDNKADIYPRFGPTSEWDIAAGHAILSSNGGHVCQILNEHSLDYSKDETILNPAFAAFRNTSLKNYYLPLLSEFYKKLV